MHLEPSKEAAEISPMEDGIQRRKIYEVAETSDET
jgi:hypothetical protein